MMDREMDREFKNRPMETSDEPDPQLTTKDVAAGAATKRAQTTEARSDSPLAPENDTALFDNRETEDFRAHWNRIQTQFVDEPRRSVEQADQLVAQTMKRLAEIFAQERKNLEQEWDRGDQVSTEDLRIALQRYRSFFDRLLTV
jgi:hypothetical protein